MSKTESSIEPHDITQEEIRHAIFRAQQMRSEAFAHYFRRFGGWIGQSVGGVFARSQRTSDQLLSQGH